MSSRAPKGLTHEQVVRAAAAELDAVGLDATSLRGVARRLDVQAPALYWYVKNKRELLNAVGTELWRPAIDAALRAAGTSPLDPRATVLAYGRALREQMSTCRDGARLLGSTRLEDAGLLESIEVPLAAWADEGGDVGAFVTLIQTAQHATIGFCLSEQLAMTPQELQARSRQLRDSPLVAAIGAATIGPADARFEAMLAVLTGSSVQPTSAGRSA